MKKKLLYALLTVVAGFIGFVAWSMHAEKTLRHSARTEQICIDNPTADSITVILDADTLPMCAYSTVSDFPMFRGEHRFRAFDDDNNLLCDTLINIDKGSEQFMLNPTRSKYIFWAVEYTSRPDLDSHGLDSTLLNMVVVAGDTLFGNLHIDSSLINIITSKDHRSYKDNLDPDRKVEEFQSDRGSSEIDYCYYIRYDDFPIVYSNIKPSSERDDLRTALHNCTNTFAQHVNFTATEVSGREKFMEVFNVYGYLAPYMLVDTFVAVPEVFRKFDPASYDEMTKVYRQWKFADDDTPDFSEQKLKPYTIYRYRLAETGWFEPEYALFYRSISVPVGDTTAGTYFLPDGSIDPRGPQDRYSEGETIFRRRN